ncbi:hypothetical protein BDA96_04G120700 [Sorghum bicolor]|uniref:Uncharacterized protein n=2 Tax=Sorghum bicolor TaxID=4558 RepID=A0A921R3Q6_SORBI|nr:hypothetical protein BDA96_04G120700 [Sorghum bicolor]KXG29938.1 hypothetical protein SORBI_3004G112300 [Sorghum bicolor]
MAGFIYAKQQTSTTPTEAAAGFRTTKAGTCARGLPAQARHKNEEKPVHFIPGISNSRPSQQVPVPEQQCNSKPASSSSPPVGFIREALQHQKAQLKEKSQKTRQKVASLIRGK